MLNLKRKFHSSKRHLRSASSSTVGSVSDLEDRVVMLCEDVPTENSFDSGRGSTSPGGRSSRGSQSEEHGLDPPIIHLSRDRLSYRQACFVEEEPSHAPKEYYIQKVVQVYEYLWCFKKLECAEFTPQCYLFFFGICGNEIHFILYALSLSLHVIRPQLSPWQSAL